MKMNVFLANWQWLLLAAFGVAVVIFAISKFHKPDLIVPTTKSANFSEDPIVSHPVMVNNPHANVFRSAAEAAINKGTNPWVYLRENWDLAKKRKGGVEEALLHFITNEAMQNIPSRSQVTLSVRDYSDPNSIVMEYRDPNKDSIMVTTGHDPEPALYATYSNGKESKTFKLMCANGLVRELNPGKVTSFEEDIVIKEGDSFIQLTGATSFMASKFAEANDLPVRFVVEGKVNSKTPNTSKVKVFRDYINFSQKSGIFDVVLQPGDILRKDNGVWLYIRVN